MNLLAPEWLLLLPALGVAAWLFPRLGFLKPLRGVCLLLLVLALAKPAIRRASDGIDLWVLADRSASAAAEMSRTLPEWEAILHRSQKPGDQLHFVDFAATPTVRGQGEITVHDVEETRTALALQFTLGQLAHDRLARILLLTDGYATEPLAPIIEPLVRSGAPLDYRLLYQPSSVDYRVDTVDAPARVQADEAFMLMARIVGGKDAEFPCDIMRDGVKIGQIGVRVSGGEGRVRFSDRLHGAGSHRYGVRILPQDDAHPENNAGEAWVEVAGRAGVLLVTAYEQDPVADVLTAHGFQVRQVTDPSELRAGSLSGCRLVILNNVPAHKLPDDFIHGLDFHVRGQGGGLLMCGGKFSFGSGGYFSSAIDPLLPVSMELRKEHRKLRVAMVIVMDRSGSMAMTVSEGGKTVEKMQLADEGAARTASLLSDSDMLSVIAVDTAPHRFVPMTEVGPHRDEIEDKVRRIRSEGGGIYIHVALEAAWKELRDVDVGQRHIILFADACDSENPEDYKSLLKKITDDGITVSVIGMGTEHDSDSDLLKDIAARGNGRIMFDEKITELPALFAEETVAIARSAFITEATELKSTPGWLEIAAARMPWLPKVDGYNLSYLKPGATAAALSGDEYGSPLVSFWQRGLGRTAAVSFPLAGDFSEATRRWPQYGDCIATLCRWLSGDEVPAGLGIESRMDGADLSLDFYYDGADWPQRIAANEPLAFLSSSDRPEPRSLPWERLAPGHFHARAPLHAGESVRGAVQIGKIALPFGPLLAASNIEWQFRREPIAELQALCAMTGGKERLNLATSFEAPPRQRFSEVQPWFLALLLVLAVLDAVCTRVWGSGFRISALFRRREPSA